jgi:hypothetical protein
MIIPRQVASKRAQNIAMFAPQEHESGKHGRGRIGNNADS